MSDKICCIRGCLVRLGQEENFDLCATIGMSSIHLFCICCLNKQVPYVSLSRCSHAEFLNSYTKPEINPENQVICHQCHDMLKKIKLFQLQVEESFKLLSNHENIPEATRTYRHNLKVHRMENIDLIESTSENNDTNIEIEFVQNSTIDKTTTGLTTIPNSSTENTTVEEITTSKNSAKLKNIESALKIINNNQNDGCINFLAASLQNLSQTLLKDNLFSKNFSDRSETNNFADITKFNKHVGKFEMVEENLDDKKGILIKEIDFSINPLENGNTNNMLNDVPTITETKTSLHSKIKKIILTKEELVEERVKSAAAQTYLSSPYRCDHCIIGFHYAENLKDHTKRKHSPKTGNVNCGVCFQSLNPGPSYDEHVSRHFTRFECLICHRRFSSSDVAFFHYRRKHCVPTLYKCRHCPYSTPVIKNLRHHFRSHRVGKISSVKRFIRIDNKM